MTDTPAPAPGTKILGGQYRAGRFYYLRFKDQPTNEWSIGQCTATRPLELGFHTIRGLVNWDNSELVVIGPVPNPPGLLSAFHRNQPAPPAISKLRDWIGPSDDNVA